ncbi:hypothetical protein N7470_001240 [Penicillium chermesinum]|nr:hypothetical protein N7470_001240 [Penicillium chermesinum]
MDAQDLEPSTDQGPSKGLNQGSGEAQIQNPPRRLPKKRTKTGCLTCRKRRIKCGEEKPICSNCVKSRRVCEGYAQRVVFKNPLGILGAAPPEHTQDPHVQQQAEVPLYSEYGPLPPQQQAAATQRPMLAPRPLETTPVGEQSYVQPEPFATGEYRYPNRPERPHDNLGSSSRYHPPPMPQVIYVEDEAEDYYDVESDDEMVEQKQAEGYNQLNLIMASASRDSQLRSFTTHLNEPNILASYRPSLGSSPLNNPKTARIFAHFIHSTGPSLSIFERHQTDSSIMLNAPVPPAKQGLWSYTLPLIALEHPALLQAILAISSLHIAYLQNAPTTVSLKHYHFALKRIGRAVSLPTRRKQIGTLAATELLAYYEVISADHSKWNSHVAGAAHLIREVDFPGLTRDLRAYRRRMHDYRRNMEWAAASQYYYPVGSGGSEDDPFADKEDSINQEFIGTLLGRRIDYDQFGHVEGYHSQAPKKHFSRKDIENFRIQTDLYWWYIKQDTIHSLISGDALFIPFDQLGRCPPRAGIGRLDAIYGSADHLWLLLSRITDFGYRDRKRKLKAIRSTGTDWRPGPGIPQFMSRFARGARPPGPPKAPGPPSSESLPSSQSSRVPTGSPSSNPSQPTPSPEGPPMYGMIPPQGPARVPSAFVEDHRGQRQTPEVLDESADVTYNEAEREWEEILMATDAFFQAVGPDFQPLPPDVTVPIDSPFGPALQYRTLNIALLWGFYYAGRILLYRLHPCMPPAMMVAAGVAAPATADYAQIIGRILAGIYYPQRYNFEAGSLSPALGSSLTDMTVPMFFGAVQYVDGLQRSWTVSKLREIARLAGWKTSEVIAGGCEKAWVIAAKHGRGPPYERSFTVSRDRESGPPDVIQRDYGHDSEHSDDRRFITVQRPYRAHMAFGLLSLESDMESLEL